VWGRRRGELRRRGRRELVSRRGRRRNLVSRRRGRNLLSGAGDRADGGGDRDGLSVGGGTARVIRRAAGDRDAGRGVDG
jgi:hypothetical protein